MKFKIVSGGQTGVDRGGLEAAIALGLPYGGWVPKGRLAEDGEVPLKYAGMQEHTSSNYAVRTKANVRDSDATLIIAPSLPLSRGTMLTLRTAERLHRPHHVACLEAENAMEEAVRWLRSFQQIDRPMVLNIAGPRESGAPGIQQKATEFLCQLLPSLSRYVSGFQTDFGRELVLRLTRTYCRRSPVPHPAWSLSCEL